MAKSDELSALVKQAVPESFTEQHLARPNRDEEADEEEALGMMVSAWTGWDGLKVMRVAIAALED
jgi:hypothetical protein